MAISYTIPSGSSYPKMPYSTVTDQRGQQRTVNLVYPSTSAKAGGYVVLNSQSDESAFDATGLVAASYSQSVQENKHHNL
jgi:hypothetical protein